jgi:hypothetical protein
MLCWRVKNHHSETESAPRRGSVASELNNWTLDKIPMAMRFPTLKKEQAVGFV